MISLILPYWQRQAATDAALARMAALYFDIDLEVIVVDDGSPVPYIRREGYPFAVRSVRLPVKSGPLNPCVPINVGAAVARGDILAISNPEIMHRTAVLPAMRDELERLGVLGYVLAACWSPEQKRWHCHSTIAGPRFGIDLPAGSGFHFLAMLHRSLWEEAGGFDIAYRKGAGYDDPDFVMRLERAGARFVIRDDLVVEHPRGGARSAWTPAQFERNRQLFISKWASHAVPA